MEVDTAQNDEGEEEAEGDSSGESGSDSGEDGSSSDEVPPTPPPPIELPDRSTRGKRLRAVCNHPLTAAMPCTFRAGFAVRPHTQRPINMSTTNITFSVESSLWDLACALPRSQRQQRAATGSPQGEPLLGASAGS